MNEKIGGWAKSRHTRASHSPMRQIYLFQKFAVVCVLLVNH
jgi:hypothetical protein